MDVKLKLFWKQVKKALSQSRRIWRAVVRISNLVKVCNEVGGLAVIGTERHESRRIDNQLRGRSGRQGDPGVTQFYLSLEDELMRRFGSDQMKSMMTKLGMDDTTPIQSKMVSRSVESAQKRVEGNNFDARKRFLQYDDVLRQQREIIYKERNEVLESENIRGIVEEMITECHRPCGCDPYGGGK